MNDKMDKTSEELTLFSPQGAEREVNAVDPSRELRHRHSQHRLQLLRQQAQIRLSLELSSLFLNEISLVLLAFNVTMSIRHTEK